MIQQIARAIRGGYFGRWCVAWWWATQVQVLEWRLRLAQRLAPLQAPQVREVDLTLPRAEWREV